MNLKIYQVDRQKDEKDVKFSSYEETMKNAGQVDPKIYRKVFDGPADCASAEDVFFVFNAFIPCTHLGHSLSVSDVIDIDGEKLFCDMIGYSEIEFDESLVEQQEWLRVMVIEPGKTPFIANIADDYKSYQQIVRGNFECFYFDEGSVGYCNDEGKLIGLPANRVVGNDVIAGTFVIAGDGMDGSTISLTDEQVEKYGKMFLDPPELTQVQLDDACFIEIICY